MPRTSPLSWNERALLMDAMTSPPPADGTIPRKAWDFATIAVFKDGCLHPDTSRLEGDRFVVDTSDDTEAVYWLSHFTIDNYSERAGAAVVSPRAPQLEGTLVRFDAVELFRECGYRNPFREPGVPDWYFF